MANILNTSNSTTSNSGKNDTSLLGGNSPQTVVTKYLMYGFEKMMKLSPNLVNIFEKTQTPSKQANLNSLSNLKKPNENGYNGYMSFGTRRKVKSIIECFLTSIELNTPMKFPFVKGQENPMDVIYPTFVTLTLAYKQIWDDNDLKRDIFEPFVQELIRNWKVKCYVWVSEVQDNGNLHFHLIIDRAIPALRLRQIWNRHLNKDPYCMVDGYRTEQLRIYRNGYVFREPMYQIRLAKERKKAKAEGRKVNTKEIRKKEEARQKNAYEKGVACNWSDPNTTDIHSIQNIKKLTAYVTSYFCKGPEELPPQLAENEELITDEKGKRWIQIKDTADTEVMFGEDRRPYVPKFKTRKMSGRIWGASKILKDPDTNVQHLTLQLFIWQKFEVRKETVVEKEQLKCMSSEDLFGNIFSEKKLVKIFDKETELFEEEFKKKDPDAEEYLKILKQKVPPEKIKKATERTGRRYEEDGRLMLIPLPESQKDLLKTYSPAIWSKYQKHYRELFDRLYPQAA